MMENFGLSGVIALALTLTFLTCLSMAGLMLLRARADVSARPSLYPTVTARKTISATCASVFASRRVRVFTCRRLTSVTPPESVNGALSRLPGSGRRSPAPPMTSSE